MRDLKRPLKRITYSKIRVFSQNWFCRGDICVSGLICLSCSLLSLLHYSLSHRFIHEWVWVISMYPHSSTCLFVPSKTKHYTRHRQDSISMETAVQSAITHRQTGSCSVSMRPWQYSGSDNIKLNCSITITAACLPMILHKSLITISEALVKKDDTKCWKEKWYVAMNF